MVEYLEPRTIYPLDLVDVQEFLRVDTNDDVDTITRMIRAATERCEGQTGRTLMTRKLRIVRNTLPESFSLERGPIQTLDKITLYTAEGEEEDIDISDVEVFDTANNGEVIKLNGRWDYVKNPKYFHIDYTAGYGDNRSDVPYDLTQSMLAYIAFLYERRGEGEVPQHVVDSWIINKIYTL